MRFSSLLTRLRTLASLYRELGPQWTLFRLWYAFRLRVGLVRLQMPVGDYESRAERSDERSSRHADEALLLPESISWNKQTAVAEADRILNGEIKYFAHQFVKTGFPPNWHKDPISGTEFDSSKHWSQLSDDSDTDIKFIWEPNRFAFVYTLVRAYVATRDEKYAEAFWVLLEDWAEKNRPNAGANWMDGQEAALRLMAWMFGFSQFSNSPASTPARTATFMSLIAAHTDRIYKNIGYAISTRSNHTISEAFGLWMIGLLYPELKHAKKYLELGKHLLEQSAAKQLYPDGTYAMHSLNYHRFVLHIYLYAIRLAELHKTQFSNSLYSSVSASIEYLSKLINPTTGEMPNYGSNDGALVLPLNNCDFTDYRPLLQLGWYITKKEFLFEPGPWDEDVFWMCGETPLTAKSAKDAKKKENLSDLGVLSGKSFPDGGIHLLHSTNSHVLLHCTDYTSRPSHADQLHMDLWMHGHEIAIDAGTYLYSGADPWRNGLARTNVHNTVTVDGKDQMQMVSRFTWVNWSKGKVLKHENDAWQGEHNGYKPVTHKRTVLALEGDCWLVFDQLSAKESHTYALHWLLSDYPFEQKANSFLLSLPEMKYKVQLGLVDGNGNLSLVHADETSTRGWRSRYYAHKEPALSLMLETNQKNATFWTFFGFEQDTIALIGNEFHLNHQKIKMVE